MILSEEQQATLRLWVDQGDGLADIQRKLQSEFDLKLTFLDTRFLVDDLQLTIHTPEKSAEEVAAAEQAQAKEVPKKPAGIVDESGNVVKSEAAEEQTEGGVSVTVDEVKIPGAMVSGKVQFSDGESGRWYIDEMGRLGFEGSDPNYRPSEEDLMAFQAELQKVMQSKRF